MPHANIQFMYYRPVQSSDLAQDAHNNSESDGHNAPSYDRSASPPLPSNTTGAHLDPFTPESFHYPMVSRRHRHYLYRTSDVSDADWDEITAIFRGLPTESILGEFALGRFSSSIRWDHSPLALKSWHMNINPHCTMHLDWTDADGNHEVLYANAHLHRNRLETIQELSGSKNLWVRSWNKLEYENRNEDTLGLTFCLKQLQTQAPQPPRMPALPTNRTLGVRLVVPYRARATTWSFSLIKTVK
ncbi:hypothetical protein BU23DRAFT_603363 [Bimuria novae-zelandiae CBS 107.79]|uniref:Uncharacterized protein n=1 Tax=Bimuria novae-zelandiae CBS 107.79 TaxID=1447943 RepID=A0A6A5UPV7_9PLEO|nr:hypothetical protein BU23DRAFT_603363 [Bimuria novae-zelandiae CBS 107.79]